MDNSTTPQDDAAMSPASTGSVDILTRLADHHAVTMWDVDEAAAEIARLRLAIRCLADQDGTVAIVGGNVTVEMDATLSPEERGAVEWCRDNITAMAHPSSAFAHTHAATLRGLLERLK